MSLSNIWNSAKKALKTVAKVAAIGLIAATGVGLAYLWTKTKIVKEGYRGISFNKGKLVLLEPGIHCLLSPTHTFERALPFEMDEVVSLEPFEIKTKDQFSAQVKANFSYKITDAQKATLKVKDFEGSLIKSVAADISSVLQEYEYEQLTTGSISRLSQVPTVANFEGMEDEADEVKEAGSRDSSPSPSSKFSSKTTVFDHIKNSLNRTCRDWGIMISRVRLISVDTTEASFRNEIAEINLAKLRAKSKEIAAKADATTILTINSAKVQSAKIAAQHLTTTDERYTYEMQQRLDMARALSMNQGTLAFGDKINPWALMSSPQLPVRISSPSPSPTSATGTPNNTPAHMMLRPVSMNGMSGGNAT